MKLFVNVYHDVRLLPFFLSHYETRGVTEYFVAVAPEFSAAADQLASGYPVTFYSELDVAESLEGTASISEMRRRHQRPDEWVVICDLDEFVEGEDLRAVAAAAERSGANVVRGIMHDRFGSDGRPRGPSERALLSDEYPIKSRFIRDVMHGCDHKCVLVKGHLEPAPRALHHWFDDELAFSEALEISHYKWICGSVERLRRNYADARDRGVTWAEEYRRALEHYDTHGRMAWESFGGRHCRDFVPESPPQCSVCDGVIWEAEFRYSLARYGMALCRTHQSSAADRAPVAVETNDGSMRHYWAELPGPNWFSAVELYAQQVARAKDGATFVELGAWKGRSTAFMAVEIALSGKEIAFFTIDHWRGSGEEAHLRDPDLVDARLYDVFLSNIGPVSEYVQPITGDTAAVAARFADTSLAFIYVDAGHTFAEVSADLVAWWPKLEQGGVIAGDDWCDSDDGYGVRRAVTAFFEPRGLEIQISPGSPNAEWLQWLVSKP